MIRAALAAAALLLPSLALADPPTDASAAGLPAEPLAPAVGPGALIGVEGAAPPTLGTVSTVIALFAGFGQLAVQQRFSGALVSRPIRSSLVADGAADLALTRTLAVGIGVPLAIAIRGDGLSGLGAGDAGQPSAPSFGDVRLRGKLLLAGGPSPLHVAVVATLTVPAGGERGFAATSGPTVEPKLVADLATRWFAVAGNLSVRFAPDRTLAGTRFGDELRYAAGAIAGWWRLRGLVELAGAVGPDTHPLELRGAIRVLLPRGLSVDGGVTGSLIDAPGTPALRLFATLRWSP